MSAVKRFAFASNLRWQFLETFFTPVCFGQIEQAQSGSRIDLTLRPEIAGVIKFACLAGTILSVPVIMIVDALGLRGTPSVGLLASAIAVLASIAILVMVYTWQQRRAAPARERIVSMLEAITNEPRHEWKRSA